MGLPEPESLLDAASSQTCAQRWFNSLLGSSTDGTMGKVQLLLLLTDYWGFCVVAGRPKVRC